MGRKGQRWWAAWGALVALSACASVGEDGQADLGCTPGLVRDCSCFDGTTGSQICLGTGQPSVCMCDPAATAADAGTVGDPVANDAAVDAPSGSDAGMEDPNAPVPQDASMPVPDAGSGGRDDVPSTSVCAEVADWDPLWAQWEEEVLVLTNEYRAAGANCDTEGNFGSTTPLTMNPTLRCAARLHSKDMGEQGYFSHTGQDGRSPFDRMEDAGYDGGAMGENIASGQTSPRQVVDGWIDSDGHCRNIMDPGFTELGVGYYE